MVATPTVNCQPTTVNCFSPSPRLGSLPPGESSLSEERGKSSSQLSVDSSQSEYRHFTLPPGESSLSEERGSLRDDRRSDRRLSRRESNSLRVVAKLAVEFCSGQSPVALDRAYADIEHFGHLGDRQSREETQLDHLALTR